MATYIELHDLRNHHDLIRKIHVAIADIAKDILDGETTPVPARVAWAKEAIADPSGKTPQIVNYVLIASKAATASQILSATDATVKTYVLAAVDKLVAPKG